MPDGVWVSPGEAAEHYGITQGTLRQWARDGKIERQSNKYRLDEPVGASDEPSSPAEQSYELREKYFYDRIDDKYVFNLPSRRKAIAIPGDIVRAMVSAYTDADGAPSTINQMADRFGLRRQTVIEMLKALEVTKTSAPWTREHVAGATEDELHEDLIRMKTERVRSKAERKEKQDAEKWQRFDLAVMDALRTMKIERPPRLPRYRIKAKREEWKGVITTADAHVMKQAWLDGQDHARQYIENAVGEIFEHVECYGPPKAWIASSLGDFSNVDNIISNTTTRGTPQRQAGSAHQAVKETVQLLCDFIEMLRTVAPVEYYEMPGNHDRTFMAVAGQFLEKLYADADDVTVDGSFQWRKAVEYEKNLIVLEHGDNDTKRSVEKIPEQFREQWGRCPHVYLLGGHWHQKRQTEYAGMMVDTAPSPSVKDAWEESMGFAGRPMLTCYLHHPQRGRFGQFHGYCKRQGDK